MKYAVCLEEKHKNKILKSAGSYDLIVVDAQDYTATEIKALKKHARVLTYLNVGAVENDRSYFSAAKKAGLILGEYDNWEGEYWVAAQKDEWRKIILGVAATLAAKGVDGFWVDNLDILYTAEEEYGWKREQLTALYNSLIKILEGLHAQGYVMINGGDVFVSRAIKAKQAGCFDGVNQETVITSILDYDPPGKFGRQSEGESLYYTEYLQEVRMAGKDVALLEYATEDKLIEEAQAFARAHGYDICVSGNIELGGDIRVSDAGSKAGTLNRLQMIIAVSDVFLGVYGTREAREKKLTKDFGEANAAQIQEEVNRAIKKDAEYTYIAVACIAGHYGAGEKRRKALGAKAEKAQARIDAIYKMRGKSIEAAAKDVINGNYDREEARELLLRFCGYSPTAVQAEVNRRLQGDAGASDGKEAKAGPAQQQGKPAAIRYRIHAEHFFRRDEKQYGDCTAIYQYGTDGKTIEKCVLIDTAKASASPVVIEDLKAQGVKKIDAVFISHAHGDHYGGLSNILKAFPVSWLYLPDTEELDKYQHGYGSALRRQAKKVKNVRWLKAGDAFQIGEIKGKCLFICPAEKLKEHDDHHFVNNESMAVRFDLGGVTFHAAGDMSNPANNVMVGALGSAALRADIYKAQWHGDANATNDTLCRALKPKVAYSNYHHAERSGRGTTRKRLEAVGCTVYRNAEDGQIYFDCEGNKITVTTSKSGKHDTYTV